MLKGKIKFNIDKKIYLYAAIVVVLLLADLLTKHYEELYHWDFVVIPGLIDVNSGARNPGCAFSFLANASWGQTLLIAMTFILLPIILCAFFLIPNHFIAMRIGISMVFSGAIGNLVDRLMFQEVRDFVDLNMFGNWASCNFADFWIVLGVVLIAVDLLFFNDWAVIPLTKRAKEAQKKMEEQENKDGE